MRIRDGTNILVATVGRLLDFIEKGVINTSKIQFVILDEADRMLDMGKLKKRKIIDIWNIKKKLGFQTSIERIYHMVPSDEDAKTSAFFSATFPEQVQAIGAEFLKQYVFMSVGLIGAANADVQQQFFRLERGEKITKVSGKNLSKLKFVIIF